MKVAPLQKSLPVASSPPSPIAETQIHTSFLATPIDTTLETDGPPVTGPQRRAPRRCRKCGLEVRKYKDQHIIPLPPLREGERPANRYLRYEEGYKPHDHCTVDKELWVEGYPLQPGQLHPRRRGRAQNNTS
eukprot:CAMPEP_0183754988 /NCGR_PEP_ID=MMETSP0739-20130205/3840_1 /TAXON_ID=385413 /ORGANISM="Thalassiosira miniscula, Strain CCMP1093" /LENGTH=131 /DNA_ID=CAMNT_0025991657 /DNA_START=14 /DNA_END=409 /DNA_ORIENTATION=+